MDIEWVTPPKWASVEIARATAITELRPAITEAVLAAWADSLPAGTYKEVAQHVREGILHAVTQLGGRPDYHPECSDESCVRTMVCLPDYYAPPRSELPDPDVPAVQLEALKWAAATFMELVRVLLEPLRAKYCASDRNTQELCQQICDAAYTFMLRHPEIGWRLSQHPRALLSKFGCLENIGFMPTLPGPTPSYSQMP